MARKTPTIAVSRMSMKTMNSFTFLVTADQVERIVIGMMKVVSIRIQREIPSTPTM